MNSSGKAPDPFDVVARALKRPRECLTEESAIYRDHGCVKGGEKLDHFGGVKLDQLGEW